MSDSSPVRIAIVGCGNISGTHARSVQALPGEAVVTAVADILPAAAEQLADAIAGTGAPRPAVYDSLEAALAAHDVDLVALTTPSGLHIEQALTVLDAGKHVLIEKPLDADLDDVRTVTDRVAAAAEDGQVASVISQHRFDPSSVIVKQAIDDGRLGRITSAIASVAWYRSQGYYDSGDWRGTWAMDGGGALMNQGVHTVDLLCWFLGTPVSVYAVTGLMAHERMEVEDTAVAVVTFESGAVAALHATTAAAPGLTVRLTVMGSKGSAVIDDDELVYFHGAPADGSAEDLGAMGLRGGGNDAEAELGKVDAGAEPEPGDAPKGDPTMVPSGHIRQYRDVLDAIRDGSQPGVTVPDAAFTLAVVRAVYISATLGQTVLVADVLAGRYDDVQPTVQER